MSDTYPEPSPPRRQRPLWKIIAAVTGVACIACILGGVVLIYSGKNKEKRTISANTNANPSQVTSSNEFNSNSNDRSSALDAQDAIAEYIAAVSEVTTSRPTNRIVPRPTARPTRRPTRPTPRPTNRIVPKPSARPTRRPRFGRPSARPSMRPTRRPVTR